MRFRKLIPIITLVVCAGLGDEAAAGTATSRSGCAAEGRVCGSETVYQAEPGEPNDLTVSSEPGFFVLVDRGSTVRASGTCVSIDSHRAHCPNGFSGPSGGGDELILRLGDRDDRAVVAAAAAVYAGGGSDNLTATESSRLLGGAGADVLTGSDESDHLDGGSGNDVIDGKGPTATGPYEGDRLSYGNRSRPVSVDLRRGIAGGTAEADVVRAIERVTGGRGADRLAGDEFANDLDGGGGDDLLQGHGGDDLLEGGTGDDRLEGGAGNDSVSGSSGVNRLAGGDGDDHLLPGRSRRLRSTVHCGSGRDRIGFTASATLVHGDCKWVEIGVDFEIARVPLIGRRQAVFPRSRCSGRSCPTGTLDATIRNRRVGTGTVQPSGRIAIKYTAYGRRVLERNRRAQLVRIERRGRAGEPSAGFTTVWPAPSRTSPTRSHRGSDRDSPKARAKHSDTT